VTVRSLQSASSAERERLLADFIRLCEIESPSGSERKIAQAVKADLEQLGLEVEEDGTAGETGSDTGNLLAALPGSTTAEAVRQPTTRMNVTGRFDQAITRDHMLRASFTRSTAAVLFAVASRSDVLPVADGDVRTMIATVVATAITNKITMLHDGRVATWSLLIPVLLPDRSAGSYHVRRIGTVEGSPSVAHPVEGRARTKR